MGSDHPTETSPHGSRSVGLGIGLVAFVVFAALPFLIVVSYYLVASVYAIVKGTTFSAETSNVPLLLTLLVMTVAVFPVALAALIALVGRSLSPKRRRD